MQKQFVLRIPHALKPEAVLVVLQSSCGHIPSAVAAAKRNALRNGFSTEDLTEADLRGAVELIRLAATSSLAQLAAPASVIQASSSVCFEVSTSEGA